MFIRVKTTPNSPRKSVQIVESFRVDNKVKQKIVKHIGVALDDYELNELKLLASAIKTKLELENTLPLYTPEEIEKQIEKSKENIKRDIYSDDDYVVNIKDLVEEDRVITGIHDIYGKMFDELDLKNIFVNPARNKSSVEYFRNIVLGRIAKPDSKSRSVHMLEENFGVSLDLDSVYKMMDKIDDKSIEKLNSIAYSETKKLFDDKIDVIYFDATTIYFESFTEDIGDDAIRKNGYSKDLKFNQPQVVLALMVTKEGLKKDSNLSKKIDKAVFPGVQGGPHMETVAAILAAAKEAFEPGVKEYSRQIVANAKALASELDAKGYRLVGGGTENHMVWLDLTGKGIDGWAAAWV